MKKYKILIVEDERMLAEMMKRNFLEGQFTVRTCYNGSDALALVTADLPDLIILDVMIPGMDGWEILSKIKSDPHTASVPVIICTGKDSVQDVERSYRAGAQAYLIKPFSFQTLLKKVAAVLDIEKLLND